MDKQRELIRTLNVGKYSFDIKVNRQMALDAFKHNEKFWNVIANLSKRGVDVENIGDIDKVAEILEENDILDSEKPKFVEFILPKMIEASGADVDYNEFIDYCKEQEVDDIVNDKIVEFAMLGFTEGKSVKTPKVKVVLA